MLDYIDDELAEGETRLVFAELKDAVRQKIESYELANTLKEDRFFPTVRTAVEAYEASSGATWLPGPGPYHLDD